MQTHLKIKIMSLAAEARIIRREEQNWPRIRDLPKLTERQQARARKAQSWAVRASLQEHRKGIVRTEARHSQLAYGFLRGMPYRSMEATCVKAPDPVHIARIARRFGYKGSEDDARLAIKGWMAVASLAQAA